MIIRDKLCTEGRLDMSPINIELWGRKQRERKKIKSRGDDRREKIEERTH
jgi:hypothetical protein